MFIVSKEKKSENFTEFFKTFHSFTFFYVSVYNILKKKLFTLLVKIVLYIHTLKVLFLHLN